MTPVEVSLCAQATTSTPASNVGAGASPGSLLTTIGSCRNGALAATLANLLENSPKLRCSERSRIRPARRRPRTRSSRRCRAPRRSRRAELNRSLRPVRTRPTRSLTGFCRCEVPSRWASSVASLASCSGRTFDGPQPKRPSAGLSSSGMVSVVALVVMGLLGVGMGVPRRAAERSPSLPGGSPPRDASCDGSRRVPNARD